VETKLVVVVLKTHEGDVYTFPNMKEKEVLGLFSAVWRPASDALTVVNVSGAVLVIPTRVLKEVHVDGRCLWVCPV